MIKRFLNKVPAGMMVIPLLLGSVLAHCSRRFWR